VQHLREFFLENFAADFEYHPRRGLIYLCLGIAAGFYWALSPADGKFTAVPLVFLLGSFTLLGKGIYLFRPSSEGIGQSMQELEETRSTARRKSFPPLPAQAAQVLQDFGTGSFLLWPLLNLGKDIDQSWDHPPRFAVFLSGAALFLFGWLIRRLTSSAGGHQT